MSSVLQREYFFEGDMTNINMLGYEYDNTLDQTSDWLLPNEPFQPRHEIFDQSPPPELSNTAGDMNRSGDEDDVVRGNDDHTNLLVNFALPPLPKWDFSKTVIDMLEYYAKVVSRGRSTLPLPSPPPHPFNFEEYLSTVVVSGERSDVRVGVDRLQR